MRQSLITVLLLSFLLAPVRGQTGPQITQSSVAGGGGVSTQGTTRVEGAIGQSSAGASSGGTFTLRGGFFAPGRGPSVLSIVRTSASLATQNSSVGYAVTFDEPVTGVDAADFQLTTTGLTGASVMNVTGSGATYDVTVGTGTPVSATAGTLRLDVVDDDTVVNLGGDLLGGTGVGNGNFNSGEVYAVEPFNTRVNDAQVSEAAAGTTLLLFTVSLSAPAPAGGISVNYSTASGGDTPATGGASCGGTTDYVTASGTTVVPVGSQVVTIPVTVCADTDSPESNETLLLNISCASSGTIQDAQAVGTITQGTTPGTFIISELRTSGPGGSADDFVELYNNTDSPLTVAASDISAGYGVYKMGADCNATPVLLSVIPNGTVIPARGHYLMVGTAYSLANYGGTGAAAGNLTMTSDIENDRNVGVFTTSEVANVSSVNRLDAVGFGTNTGGVCDLLREGTTLAPVSGTTTEHSYFRKQCDFVTGTGCTANGNPKDTNDNAGDFHFADTQGTFISGVTQRLGAPGPENVASPIRRDTTGVFATLLDSTVSSSVVPNRMRDFTSNPGNNSTFGTLSIRRRVTNTTGAPVTRLRFRIVEMTTFPSPGGGQADMRAISSTSVSVSGVNDFGTCSPAANPCTVTVQGTTLETPPSQPNGGGYNSTLSAGTVTLGTPLANNSAVNVQFLLGIQQTGTFRFFIIVEALP
jgi:hypothetical protein